MTLATYLTLFRVVLSPIFLLVYTQHESLGISSVSLPFFLLFIWTLAELSDAFDGYLARRFDEVTDFGKILDPMADSIARVSAFLTFTLQPVNLPLAVVVVFIYRDMIISTLRTICALKGFALAARKSGKIKAVIQAVAIVGVLLLMIPYSLGYITQEVLQWNSLLLTSLACVYTVLSGVEYLYANAHYLKQVLTPQRQG